MKKVALIIVVLSLQNVFSQVTLLDTTNRYDYVIITVPEFVSACEVFAQHKENVRDLKTLIVDTTMILNEFNTDSLLQDNIRAFISYAGTYWEEPQPRYFLLVGNLNMIPNHKINIGIGFFPSDYKYSQSIYEEDSLSVEFFIGRVPASNIEEIGNYFTKVINYESDINLYSWNNNALFFAEYDFNNFYTLHQYTALVVEALPDFINSTIMFEDSSADPTALHDSLIYFINDKGMSSVWFFRLDSRIPSSLGVSNFYSINEINNLTNSEMPFVFFNMTSQYPNNDTTDFNKKFLLSAGGSIAGIIPVGLVFYPTIIYQLKGYAENLYLTQTKSLGEVLLYSQSNTLKPYINLFGDPSIQLKYDVTTDVKPISSFPTEYSLEQNYPNPFNPKTIINFSTPVSGNVEMKIYNVLGKEIKVLTEKFYNAGRHQVEFDGSELSSGVYIYTIRSGEFHQTRKMILMK